IHSSVLFSPPPTQSNITLCELNGELINPNESNMSFRNFDETDSFYYPDAKITVDSLKKSLGKNETAQLAFLEHSQTLKCRLQTAYNGHGIYGALNEINSSASSEALPMLFRSVCQNLLSALRWVGGMQLPMFPHLNLSDETSLIASISQNNDWIDSPIRFISWHCKANKFALALKDDTVKVYYHNNDLVPTLKHKLQRNVSDVQWKPFAASLLAVAAQTAVLIWTIDPCSLSSRPYSGSVQVLSFRNHSPVSSVAWNPHGYDQLFTSCVLSSAILVWNVGLKKPQVIQHISRCAGVTRLLFSPDGEKVLASTPSSSFRVFETSMWSNERWSQLSGRLQAACWNYDGRILLFSLLSDPRIYSLTFGNSKSSDQLTVDGSKHATVVIDLSSDEQGDQSNVIHSMIWDESGSRLAVMFDKHDFRSARIALFATSSNPVFSITLKGYIEGRNGCLPQLIAFKPNCSTGACLTICYSDGNITYVPLYFKRSQI
uniref:Aladin seven-bladed propeller domain-containing protein n=1 Tax=Ciona intestinalis TaxID=7719 RepID=H2XWF9_CIOIN